MRPMNDDVTMMFNSDNQIPIEVMPNMAKDLIDNDYQFKVLKRV